MAVGMKIGGLQKTSFIDYPDHLSAVVWTVGCNFRCPFCYNRDLVSGKTPLIPQEEILSFLKKRSGMLEAVVISGGEPLMHQDLAVFITKIKKFGYLVKVDTNGSFPKHLKTLLENNLLDYVAMDIKAPKEKYGTLCGSPVNVDMIDESIQLLTSCASAYEFRTTFIPSILTQEDIVAIARWIAGAQRFYLQQFKPFAPLVSPQMEKVKPYEKKYAEETLDLLKPYIAQTALRGF